MSLGKGSVYRLLEAERFKPLDEYAFGNTKHRYWLAPNGEKFAVPDEDECCDPEILASIIAAGKP
jgi:hypothetical protein